MKKIFTLVILTAGIASFASAQSYSQKDFGFKDDKKVSYDRDNHNAFDKDKSVGYNDSYFSYKAKVDQINREFDQKIADVKHSWRLNRREKDRQIDMLQKQRQFALDKLQHDFEKSSQKDKDYGHDKHW
ncbi:MAG: hypothetical protein JST86_20560 [Bacteroidetes bacterium]|nr:hypothetical protein [Bacteroidota bacterium]